MKYAYAFLAAVLLVGASALPISLDNDEPISDLDRDIIDFAKLIPQEELERVFREHGQDPELGKAVDYLFSDSFHKLVYAAEDLHEFHRYVYYLQKSGYNAIRELRVTHKALGMKDYVPPANMTGQVMAAIRKGGGFNGLMDDLIAILPKKEIKALHAKKVKESPAFAKFSSAILSPVFTEIRTNLYAQKPMQALLQGSRANGVDFVKFYSLKYQILGFEA